MSRFVEVALELGTLVEVEAALVALGLACERTDEPLVLSGGIECGDVPVEIRLAAGVADNAEGFGFVAGANGEAVLVCSDADRSRLSRGLLVRLVAEITRARIATSGALVVEETTRSADGAIVLRVRRR